MRARSETIYALDKDEYMEQMEAIQSRRNIRRNNRPEDFIFKDEDFSLAANLQDDLSHINTYKLSVIQPSLHEKEEEDELNLLKSIDELNRMNKKIKNQNELSQRNRMMSEDLSKKTVQNTKSLLANNKNENSEDYFNRLSLQKSNSHKGFFISDSFSEKEILSKNEFPSIEIKGSTKPDSINLENPNFSVNSETFLNQNLITYEEVLKIIVIGDKAVGKSLLVKKFIFDKSIDNNLCENYGYVPTESLEIKKVFQKVGDTETKIELWDTNLSIINSLIVKSKILSNKFFFSSTAYYKICQGFILICDYERIESFTFIEKQLENIFNYSNYHNNILLLINKKIEAENSTNTEKSRNLSAVDSKIDMISNKFNITPILMNLSDFSRNDKNVRAFLKKVLSSKLGLKSNKKTSKENPNSVKSHRVERKAPLDLFGCDSSRAKKKKGQVFGTAF